MPRVGSRRLLTAVGVTCGIGSMLVGARQAGFRVVGNVEWRRYYHHRDDLGRNTFTENFPGAFMAKSWDELTDAQVRSVAGCDLVMAHAECGAFSNLRSDKRPDSRGACDIPLTTDLVSRIGPRFFAMDNLPPSLGVFPMAEYVRRLPGYDIFPEWVSNYHYGNPQKNRKRLFVLGARREERWVFRPGEIEDQVTVEAAIGDLCTDGSPRTGYPNHFRHSADAESTYSIGLDGPGRKVDWGRLRDYFLSVPPGRGFCYPGADGRMKQRFGMFRTYWDRHSHVITGQLPTMHPLSGFPLTVRERARLQGFPDDFVFYGERLDDAGRWDHEKNAPMIKQTGKAMPVQFCRYVARQVRDHIEKRG